MRMPSMRGLEKRTVIDLEVSAGSGRPTHLAEPVEYGDFDSFSFGEFAHAIASLASAVGAMRRLPVRRFCNKRGSLAAWSADDLSLLFYNQPLDSAQLLSNRGLLVHIFRKHQPQSGGSSLGINSLESRQKAATCIWRCIGVARKIHSINLGLHLSVWNFTRAALRTELRTAYLVALSRHCRWFRSKEIKRSLGSGSQRLRMRSSSGSSTWSTSSSRSRPLPNIPG